MQTYSHKILFVGLTVAGLCLGAVGTGALDGKPVAADETINPGEIFRTGARAYYSGDKQGAVDAFSQAAERGHPIAQWKLGRMYADGDGVAENDLKAFEYFSRVANAHADIAPGSLQSRFVASAFVSLGAYYLTGIENSPIKQDAGRARNYFRHAASYFGDANAQYQLGRLYLGDPGGDDGDPRLAVRWLKLAARKGHVRAQALLGVTLYDRLGYGLVDRDRFERTLRHAAGPEHDAPGRWTFETDLATVSRRQAQTQAPAGPAEPVSPPTKVSPDLRPAPAAAGS